MKELKCNLMSIRSLTKKGYKVIFEEGSAYIYLNNKIKFVAELNGKLYEVVLFKAKCESACASIAEQANLTEQNLWHFRLGHLNVADMKRLVDKQMVGGINKLKIKKEADFCESCVYGKQTRQPFPKRITPRSNRILELIHSDVCGPMSQSAWDGSNYFVTFMDYSRASMVYCIKRKGEVMDEFREYVAMAEALHERKISKLRMDNGGEYTSNEIKYFCKERGIQFDTPRHTIQNKMQFRNV